MAIDVIANHWRAWRADFPGKTRAIVASPRWRRRAAWSVGGLLAFWAVGYAALPWLIKSQVEKIASEKLGRQVTLGKVDFKPWSLELTLSDLAIARAGGNRSPQEKPQLAVRRIYIDAELESLLRLAPVADEIEVDEPEVALTHLGNGRYDIDDILERLQPKPDAPAGEPQRFALYNLKLHGGKLDFNDQAVGRKHELRELDLSVPFLSNLQSQREIRTAPHLAFKLNGSLFDTAAEGTPFAQTRKTDAIVRLSGFDIAPYLVYLPASLPWQLKSAVLNADARIAFEQAQETVVKVSGSVTASQVRLDVASGELLAFDRLRIDMADVRPLEQSVRLSSVELTAPRLSVRRDKAGRLNLLPVAAKAPAPAVTASASASAAAPASGAAGKPWKVVVAQVALRDGSLDWLDQTLASPAQIRLAGLNLDASAIALPFAADAPLQFSGSAGLGVAAPVPPKAGAAPAAAPAAAAAPLLRFSGTATDQAARVSATVAAWPLGMAAKYVGEFLLPALAGQLDAELGIDWQAAGAGKPQQLRITAPQFALGEVQLAQGKVSLVSVKKVELAGVEIDLPGQSFKAASMKLGQPKALVDRDAEKRWMYERWLVTRAGAAAPAPATPAERAAAPAWAVAIADLQLDGGSLSFSDKAGARPVAFEISAVKARLGGLVLDERPAGKALAARPVPLAASLKIASGRFEPGKVEFNGSLAPAPLQAQGRLAIERLPVQAFEPWFADILNIELLRADASFKGTVGYRQGADGPVVRLGGDVALEEFKANTLAPSEDLLAWKALNLRGLQVALEPGKATRIDVRETVLNDFFARVVVQPDGRINLQDLVKSSAPAGTASVAAIETTRRGTATTSALPVAGVATAAPAAGPAPIVNFGPLSLIHGRVLFSDRFVKPNYSADLSELTGKLSAFSSVASAGTPAMADLELRGRAEGSASLEILGQLNPLAKPLALDIKGKVRDLELPPLSPYSVKYSGYGINRGKLSVDVNYVVLPDGRLTASNKVVLNQLAFGDKVEGSTASLPVKLAVALLADRNGVIDIDLPISGSLNDPQFSLGPIIVKVILNVIVKAITAPFSLLAGAFGGGADELSTAAFAPGSARLEPDVRAGLDKVAKALADRPALRLTVVGTSSVEAERDGFKRERLGELVRAEKRRGTVKDGGTTTAVVTVDAAEYPALLKEVYKRADMPKPRNAIGFARDLPTAEMEKLLLADIQVGDEAMRELALRRGVAVRDYLASRGLAPERLFLGAAKAVPPEAKWTPRAELNLAAP